MVSSSFYYAKFFPMSPIWVCLCLIMPGGLPSMGSHRVGHDWHDLTAAACLIVFWPISFGTFKKKKRQYAENWNK